MISASIDPKWQVLHDYLMRCICYIPKMSPAKGTVPRIASILVRAGLTEPVDLSFLDESDLAGMGLEDAE